MFSVFILCMYSERRAVFERYVKSKANSDKSEKEQKHNKAKTAFMDLLDQAKKDGTLRYCIREQRRGRLPMDTITKEFRDDPRLNGVNAALLTLKEKESILEKKLEEVCFSFHLCFVPLFDEYLLQALHFKRLERLSMGFFESDCSIKKRKLKPRGEKRETSLIYYGRRGSLQAMKTNGRAY